jgi:1-acyl-sn-glycerol-3-phosphate acyltransferase
MPDSEASDSQAGATVELALSDIRGGLPAGRDDLRDQLPGIEPDRHLTDWGRSERVEGLIDRTLYEFLYRYWFRVEVEGIDNVPLEGPALLIANHSGVLPSDGAMILKAIREEHPHRRRVHLASEQQIARIPGLGMLFTKLGGVGAHPANVHRLLFDERQLVLAFPEGGGAARKPLAQRYRLRGFRDAAFVRAAIRAGAPIVPVAVLGAEEAQPVLVRVNPLRRLTRLPRLPVGSPVPLPAKFRVRFLEPVAAERLGDDGDQALAAELGEEIRALMQENLLEMVAQRQSVWLG